MSAIKEVAENKALNPVLMITFKGHMHSITAGFGPQAVIALKYACHSTFNKIIGFD